MPAANSTKLIYHSGFFLAKRDMADMEIAAIDNQPY